MPAKHGVDVAAGTTGTGHKTIAEVPAHASRRSDRRGCGVGAIGALGGLGEGTVDGSKLETINSAKKMRNILGGRKLSVVLQTA